VAAVEKPVVKAEHRDERVGIAAGGLERGVIVHAQITAEPKDKRDEDYYCNKMFDTALDRSIVLGYGRIGLLARRRLPGWPADPPRMDGAAVLVTGAASGLGLAAACGFARLGATVYALARDSGRAGQAVAQIGASVPGADARAKACDLSSLAAVNSFAAEFAAREPRLDVLVNNAGVMPSDRTRSVDGHELMFATHVLAPLALGTLLAGLLTRIINVGSGGMYTQSLPENGDWESDRTPYGPKKLYARTKREQVVITELLAERLRGRGVVVHAMHPGWADTEGVRRSMPTFETAIRPIIRTAEEGADTIVWLGAAPEPLCESGLFWHDRRPRPTHYRIGPSPSGDDARERDELWAYCAGALREAGIESL
jgi:dehydrogenase/reductase SDR family member 12